MSSSASWEEGATKSADVTKALRRQLWPSLQEQGFTRTTGRTFYRDLDGMLDVLNVRSMSSYDAEGIGCTTASFKATVGFELLDLPVHPVRLGSDGQPSPDAAACVVHQGGPTKTLPQPWFTPYGRTDEPSDRSDIWFVREDGANLEECVADLITQVERVALPWFEVAHGPSTFRQALWDAARAPVPQGFSSRMIFTDWFASELMVLMEFRAGRTAAAIQHLDELEILKHDALAEGHLPWPEKTKGQLEYLRSLAGTG